MSARGQRVWEVRRRAFDGRRDRRSAVSPAGVRPRVSPRHPVMPRQHRRRLAPTAGPGQRGFALRAAAGLRTCWRSQRSLNVRGLAAAEGSHAVTPPLCFNFPALMQKSCPLWSHRGCLLRLMPRAILYTEEIS